MSYCSTHYIEFRGLSCPKCDREAEHQELAELAAEEHRLLREHRERREEQHDELIDALSASDYRRANPGDYQCPHCRFITLKLDASRCRDCTGVIPASYWTHVREVEQKAREEAAAKQRIAELARAKAAAEESKRLEQEAASRRKRQSESDGLIVVILLLALVIALVGAIISTFVDKAPFNERGMDGETYSPSLPPANPTDTLYDEWIPGRTPMGEAASDGSADRVRDLVASGADVNHGFGYKGSSTPLMAAAAEGHTEVVSILVEAGADLDRSEDATGLTALGFAARAGHLEVVGVLLRAGASMKGGGEYDPMPALHAAAEAGNAEVVRTLLSAGADPGERYRGQVAVDLARTSNRQGAVEILTRLPAREP